jgi:hypothetical protein
VTKNGIGCLATLSSFEFRLNGGCIADISTHAQQPYIMRTTDIITKVVFQQINKKETHVVVAIFETHSCFRTSAANSEWSWWWLILFYLHF